jgi:chromosome segregation ATPase
MLAQATITSLEAQLTAAQASRDSFKKDAADASKQLKQLGPKLEAAENRATEAAEAAASLQVRG